MLPSDSFRLPPPRSFSSDVIRLKKIEEMVEVYYNSGQFRNTMEQLEQAYASSFEMYGALADYYIEDFRELL